MSGRSTFRSTTCASSPYAVGSVRHEANPCIEFYRHRCLCLRVGRDSFCGANRGSVSHTNDRSIAVANPTCHRGQISACDLDDDCADERHRCSFESRRSHGQSLGCSAGIVVCHALWRGEDRAVERGKRKGHYLLLRDRRSSGEHLSDREPAARDGYMGCDAVLCEDRIKRRRAYNHE